MTHVNYRWAKDRSDLTQLALFNGVGVESWENVWGAFNGFTPRDAAELKRTSLLLRWLGRWEFIQGYDDWEPHTPAVQVSSATSVIAQNYSKGWQKTPEASCNASGTWDGFVSVDECLAKCEASQECQGVAIARLGFNGQYDCSLQSSVADCEYPSYGDTYTRQTPPAVPTNNGIYGSMFVRSGGHCVFTVVNRAYRHSSASLNLTRCPAAGPGAVVYDLYRGQQMNASSGQLALELVDRGMAAVLVLGAGWELQVSATELDEVLQASQALDQTGPVEKLSREWKYLEQKLQGMRDSERYTAAPTGMVEIPRTTFRFLTAGVELEAGCDRTEDELNICCSNAPCDTGDNTCSCGIASADEWGVDFQFPFDSRPKRYHARNITVGPVFLDKHLVTKLDYARYLNSSGYSPKDSTRFLFDWDNGTLPAGREDEPVVYVGIEEARAYCEWAGKRLPHSYEWQLAAQGGDGRPYPWGSAPPTSETTPVLSPGPALAPLPRVGSLPAGNSPFNVSDLVGFVWQYTDEFRDSHDRAVLVKGSGNYHPPQVSAAYPASLTFLNWYFPPALEVNKHNKYFLMSPSFERAGTLGFRCAADHAKGLPGPYHYEDADVQELMV